MSTAKKAEYTQLLTQARTELKGFITSLSDQQLTTPVISDGGTWTVLDVLAHLAENERGMSIHVYKIRNGRGTVPEGFQINEWNAGLKERMGSPTLPELLDMLDETRAQTLETMQSLGDEEWTLTGRHPVQGIITIEQYYRTMANHDREHLADIKRGLGL
ncbi:MAG TPA: DinB family protein [Anaerolineae bacterium]|nr:DinB family protein [Anaerolineae bacterium]HMR62828.1 DinB family protein [Anaerolineae bacterium]